MNKKKNHIVFTCMLTLFVVATLGFSIKPLLHAYDDLFPKVTYHVACKFSIQKNSNTPLAVYTPESNKRQSISKLNTTVSNKEDIETIEYSFIFKGKSIQYQISDDISVTEYLAHKNTKYLENEHDIPSKHYKISALAKVLSEHQNDIKSVIQSVYDYVHYMPNTEMERFSSIINSTEKYETSIISKPQLFIALCRNRGLSARLKQGIILEDQHKKTSHLWAEVFIREKWVPFDVFNGHFAYLPAHYLELYAGDHYLFNPSNEIVFDYTLTSKNKARPISL